MFLLSKILSINTSVVVVTASSLKPAASSLTAPIITDVTVDGFQEEEALLLW